MEQLNLRYAPSQQLVRGTCKHFAHHIHRNVQGQSHFASVIAIVQEVIGAAQQEEEAEEEAKESDPVVEPTEVADQGMQQRPQRELSTFSTGGQDAIGIYLDCGSSLSKQIVNKNDKQAHISDKHRRHTDSKSKTNTTP